jgi:hypothetical protein
MTQFFAWTAVSCGSSVGVNKLALTSSVGFGQASGFMESVLRYHVCALPGLFHLPEETNALKPC